MDVDIAIVGGGLGGLALAVGLRHRGFEAHVFEAAQELRTATSTLIGLGDNAFAALEGVCPDIVPALQQWGARTARLERHIRPPGASMPPVINNNPDGGLWTFRWAKVQNVLAGLLPERYVHCGHRAVGYTEVFPEDGSAGDTRPASSVLVHFKGKPDVRAKLVVAADGLRSALRQCMHPSDPGPRYLGHMNWNALLHNPEGSVVPHLPGTLKSVSDAPPGGDFNCGVYCIDAGEGYTFWQVRTLSPEPLFTAEQQQKQQQAAAADNGQHSAGGTGGAAGATEAASPRGVEVVGGGMGVVGSKARVLEVLQERGWSDVMEMVEATPEAQIFERAMLDVLPLRSWISPGGGVALLGDAVHGMHSGPGQGARMAFEDAHQLCLALGECGPDLSDRSRLSQAVQRYASVRMPRATAVQAYAAEGCGLPAISERMRPQVPAEKKMARFLAAAAWLNQYPENMFGDPASEFFNPEQVAAAVERAFALAEDKSLAAA